MIETRQVWYRSGAWGAINVVVGSEKGGTKHGLRRPGGNRR